MATEVKDAGTRQNRRRIYNPVQKDTPASRRPAASASQKWGVGVNNASEIAAYRHACEEVARFGLEGASDEVLIRRVAEVGDGQAMSELYDRYGGLAYSAGMRYLADRGLAEDLVQDVFFAVWRGAGGFDPAKASFSTWIQRVTRNRATDLARHRRARVRTVAPDRDDTTPEPKEGDAAEEVLRGFEVVGVLSALSPVHREVLVLAYFGGLSQREISRRTGAPLGTVKSRTTAALRAAREHLRLAERCKVGPKPGRSEAG